MQQTWLDLALAVRALPALASVYLCGLTVCGLNDTVCVCLRRRRGRLIGAVSEQMVPARHWTSDRGKINAHNFKTKKKLINMEEHKIALHQCRILINRCFVCGLLVFFSPLLFSNGDNLCFFRAEGRLWRFQIKLVCFFSLLLTRSPPSAKTHLHCLLLIFSFGLSPHNLFPLTSPTGQAQAFGRKWRV